MTATPIPRSLALHAVRQPGRFGARRDAAGAHADRDRNFHRERGSTRSTRSCARNSSRAIAPTTSFRLSRARRMATSAVGGGDGQAARSGPLGGFRIGTLHGRMRPAEKERAMRAFRDGALDVLVATTVVEVGIDVPEASVIVVVAAERYGLAQLHQLRGRVGRGARASRCCLVVSGDDDARARLDARLERDGPRRQRRRGRARGPADCAAPAICSARDKAARCRCASPASSATARLIERSRATGGELAERDPALELRGIRGRADGACADAGFRLQPRRYRLVAMGRARSKSRRTRAGSRRCVRRREVSAGGLIWRRRGDGSISVVLVTTGRTQHMGAAQGTSRGRRDDRAGGDARSARGERTYGGRDRAAGRNFLCLFVA